MWVDLRSSSLPPMQEFSSVIASSYDAESLAPMLTDKAAEGWSVVSIVSAGTNVIAYLTRGGGGEQPVVTAPATIVGASDVSTEVADDASDHGVPIAADAGAIDDATITTPDPEPIVETTPEPANSGGATTALAGGLGGDTAAPVETNDETTTESVAGAAEHAGAGAGSAEAAATPAPADVPAGWYADPSERYELRYWDGAAWTEHVSRAGQQYTDPPVA